MRFALAFGPRRRTTDAGTTHAHASAMKLIPTHRVGLCSNHVIEAHTGIAQKTADPGRFKEHRRVEPNNRRLRGVRPRQRLLLTPISRLALRF